MLNLVCMHIDDFLMLEEEPGKCKLPVADWVEGERARER